MMRRNLNSRLSLVLILAMVMTMLLSSMSVYADELVASGEEGGLQWQIDSNGCLTLTGDGLDTSIAAGEIPWGEYEDSITSVKIDAKNIAADGLMFYAYLNNLETIDATDWDMSNVSDLDLNLETCPKLKTFIAPAHFGPDLTIPYKFYYGTWKDSEGYTVDVIARGKEKPETYTRVSDLYINRLYGNTRYETSLAIADAMIYDCIDGKLDVAIVTDGRNYPDALAGSYLAIANCAPILIVDDRHMNQVANYLDANMDENGLVYILGGTSVVSTKVEKRIRTSFKTSRISGASRYDTNLAILEKGIAMQETKDLSASKVIVCSGTGYADSLSASSSGDPILLVNPDTGLSNKQKEFLKKYKANSFVIAGGLEAVPSEVEESLAEFGTVVRKSGETRYETSYELANYFADENGYSDAIGLAYGENFPDGLCAGPYAYYRNLNLLLCKTDEMAYPQAFVEKWGPKVGIAFGSANLISDEVVMGLFDADFMFINGALK